MSAAAPASSDPVRGIACPKRRSVEARRRFDALRVPFPRQRAAVDALDEVRLCAEGRDPSTACGGAILVAPYGVGKTVALETLAAEANTPEATAEGRMPFLHVKMSVAGTVDAIPTQILKALGRPKPHAGKENVRWDRAIDAMRQVRVDLTAFDEFNRASRRPTMSGPIAEAIRERILDDKVCHVAIVGSAEAATVLRAAPALMERLDEQIDLDPLDSDAEADGEASLYAALLAEFDAGIVAAGILDHRSGLDDPGIAEKLRTASSGTVRRTAKLLRSAVATATGRGDRAMTREDLAEAIEAWAVAFAFLDANPMDER